jgi:hypothetical protein
MLLSASTAQKVHPVQENWSVLSNVGSPAGPMSLSIMLDQTGDTLNYDIASRMEFTEIYGDILTSPAPTKFAPDHNKSYLDATLGEELSPDLHERLFFAFHDQFASSNEISITELVDFYEKECEDYTLCLKKCIDRGVIPVSA